MKVLIAGDFCIKETVDVPLTKADNAETAKTMREMIADYDIRVVNFESVITDGKTPIAKSGPPLKSPWAAAELAKEFGFDICACANNHFGDYGQRGVLDTLHALEGCGFQTVGAGANAEEAENPLYVENIVFLNFAEHEFGIAGADYAGTAEMDFYKNRKAVREAAQKAEYVIVYLHGGNEHCPFPREGMIQYCRGLAEAGAAAVIVAHAHCPQGYEYYNGVPIAYGLGNFCFPGMGSDNPMWRKGYMAGLSLENGRAELTPVFYEARGNGMQIHPGWSDCESDAYINYLSGLIGNQELRERLWLAWCEMYINWASAYMDRFCFARGSTDESVLFLRNAFTCESHCELMRTYLTAFCDGKLKDLTHEREIIKTLQAGMLPEA